LGAKYSATTIDGQGQSLVMKEAHLGSYHHRTVVTELTPYALSTRPLLSKVSQSCIEHNNWVSYFHNNTKRPRSVEKHQLNKHFNWHQHVGPFRLISDEQARQYDRDGYLVFEDVFDEATIDGLLAELDPIEQLTTDYLRSEGGTVSISRAEEITFAMHLVLRSKKAKAFTLQPFFQQLCHDLLGPDVRLYWDQLVYKKPGNKQDFPWHQDNGYTFIEPQQYLTCWVALSDADEKNGCPWLIPGAHREGTYKHWQTSLGLVCTDDVANKLSAPVRRGGVVVFSSLTPHMTGPNLTDKPRKTYIVQYAPDGVRAISNNSKEQPQLCNRPDRQYRILTDGQAPNAGLN